MTNDTATASASATEASTTPTGATSAQVTWFEIHTPDAQGATAFYGGLFGWTFTDLGDAYHGYQLIEQGDGAVTGGGIAVTDGESPARALPSVQVTDVAAVVARAGGLGGTVVAAPQQTPDGLTFAYLADRDGSVFGVWSPPGG